MMEKSLFERMGGTYEMRGDYRLPCLALPAEEKPVGVWGQRHLRYIRQHRKALCTALWMGGGLHDYLADIDRQAEEMFFQLVKDYAQRQGITERLKAENQMEWVGKMNSIQNSVLEIVNEKIIFSA